MPRGASRVSSLKPEHFLEFIEEMIREGKIKDKVFARRLVSALFFAFPLKNQAQIKWPIKVKSFHTSPPPTNEAGCNAMPKPTSTANGRLKSCTTAYEPNSNRRTLTPCQLIWQVQLKVRAKLGII